MKSESEAITDDEFLLRRVHRTRFRTAKIPVISPHSFEPRIPGPRTRDPDSDGISLYRESCLNAPEDCLQKVTEEKRPEWGVVRVLVGEVRRIGLTVMPSHDVSISGHVVIPELNDSEYVKNRETVLKHMDSLAMMASRDGHIAVDPRPDSVSGYA